MAQATAERHRRKATAASVELNLAKVQRLEDALAVEIRRRESAERAAEMAENALATEIHRQESAKRAVDTAEKALADEANKRRQATARRKRWRMRRLPRTSTTRTTTMLRGGLRHMLHLSLLALMPSWPKS